MLKAGVDPRDRGTGTPVPPGARAGPALARVVGAGVLYAVLSLGMQRDLLPHLGDHVYRHAMLGQDCLLHVWTIAWGQHALAHEPCRVFDANIFHPEPRTLLYSDHLLGLSVLAAPLRLFTDNVVLVHNLLTLAAPALDALALYLLAFDLTRRRTAAFVGGALYGFAALRFAIDRCQIQMLAAWWLPLILLWALRAVRGDGRRFAVLAGVALALQGLTGIYLTAFFAPFLALAHVAWLRHHAPARAGSAWGTLLAAEGAAALVLLPFAMAYREVQTSLGITRAALLNVVLSLEPADVFSYLPAVTLAVLATAGIVLRGVPGRLRAERGLLLAIALGGLVLSLGPAITLPGDLGTIRGPYAPLMDLPGFTALRVPARMIHVALLGAAVLAAGGFAAMTARLGRAARVGAGILVLALATFENPPPSLEVLPAPPPAALGAVYRWLAARPPEMRIVELPLDPFAARAALYQYASTLHWRQMLNGNTGVVPPLYPYMQRELERFPDRDVLAELVALGITHAVVHESGPPPDAERIAGVVAARRLLKVRHVSPGAVVYAIRPSLRSAARAPSGHRLDRAGWRVTATAAADLAARAIDDDPATTWQSWGDFDAAVRRTWYDRVPLLTRWWRLIGAAPPAYGPGGLWYHPAPELERWWRAVSARPVRLTVDLGERRDLTAVAVRLDGSDPWAIAQIAVESSLDGERWTPLPARLEPLPDVRALVRDATTTRFGVLLPDVEPARFVRLSASGVEWRVGDLAAYASGGDDPH
jgi:hypothetical protein